MTPKFSLIIPAFNVAQYLPECLQSIVDQSFTDWEAVVIDDGSTDSTGRIAEEWGRKDSRFRVIHQANQGLSVARNEGIKAAQGDYVLFLDGDDWLELDALAQINGNIQDEDILCFTGHRYFEDTKQFEEPDILKDKSYLTGWDYYVLNALKDRKFPFVCVVLQTYRQEFLLCHNLFFKEGIYHEDNLFTPLAYYYAQKTRVTNLCLYNYRVRANSIMTTPSLKHMKDMLLVANYLSHFFAEKTDLEKTTVYRYITHMYQRPFEETKDKQAEAALLKQVDWNAYYTVSRTKLRHRVQYAALRLSPALFRWIVRITTSR